MERIAQKLIGEVIDNNREYIGNQQVDYKRLSTPFERDGAGRVFCEGCGEYMEINKEGAEALTFRITGKPSATAKLFFIVSKCYSCGEKKEFENPRTVEIQ